MARSAERRQLEALYRSRLDDFLRIAASIAGDEAAGQDAVQEAFAHALRSLHRFRGEAPLEAWVWRIVLNAARDRRRTPSPEVAPDHAETASAESHERAESEFAGWIAG